MNNEDILSSHELIRQSCSDEQTEALTRVIENLQQVDLTNINDYLCAGVAVDSDWRAYLEAFMHFEWYELTYAFHHVMSRDLTLD